MAPPKRDMFGTIGKIGEAIKDACTAFTELNVPFFPRASDQTSAVKGREDDGCICQVIQHHANWQFRRLRQKMDEARELEIKWKTKGYKEYHGTENEYQEMVVDALKMSRDTMRNIIYEARYGTWKGRECDNCEGWGWPKLEENGESRAKEPGSPDSDTPLMVVDRMKKLRGDILMNREIIDGLVRVTRDLELELEKERKKGQI